MRVWEAYYTRGPHLFDHSDAYMTIERSFNQSYWPHCPQWEWQDDEGTWHSYERDVCQALNEHGKHQCSMRLTQSRGYPKSQYIMDTESLTQTNIETGKTWPIRLAGVMKHGSHAHKLDHESHNHMPDHPNIASPSQRAEVCCI